MADGIHAGNLYVNRNQIGAVVGSQPFGGEGLSGTGPKAGGPLYLQRFCKPKVGSGSGVWVAPCDVDRLQAALLQAPENQLINQLDLPGPTGEENTLRQLSRGPILCLGPGIAAAQEQAYAVRALGGVAVIVDGHLVPEQLKDLESFHAVIWWGDAPGVYAQALAAREGTIIPLITHMPDLGHVAHERHLCVDTTASGGNAALLAG